LVKLNKSTLLIAGIGLLALNSIFKKSNVQQITVSPEQEQKLQSDIDLIRNIVPIDREVLSPALQAAFPDIAASLPSRTQTILNIPSDFRYLSPEQTSKFTDDIKKWIITDVQRYGDGYKTTYASGRVRIGDSYVKSPEEIWNQALRGYQKELQELVNVKNMWETSSSFRGSSIDQARYVSEITTLQRLGLI